MIGVITLGEALQRAEQLGLDVVEISPNADPPVCRIMDFGKFKYEQSRKEREARKHQHSADMKEMKFHANVAEHDFHTKVTHIRGFLEKGMKVKASLFFRGRENAHRELGFEVMKRVLKECDDLAAVDMSPKLMGSSIVMVIGPRSGKPSQPRDQAAPRFAAPVIPSAPPVA
jgi:translation initiation factor IF-3